MEDGTYGVTGAVGDQAGGHSLPAGEGVVGRQCVDLDALLCAHDVDRADGSALGGTLEMSPDWPNVPFSEFCMMVIGCRVTIFAGWLSHSSMSPLPTNSGIGSTKATWPSSRGWWR